MFTEEQIKQDVTVIRELIALGSRDGYSNYCLEGPRDEKTRVIGFACLYPEDGVLPSYRFITFAPKSRPEVERLRAHILGFTVEPRILEMQCDQITEWSDNPATGFFLNQKADEARSAGWPLVFIMFGSTQPGDQETAHIYHPGSMPTTVALNLLQAELRRTIAEEGN